MLGYLILLVAFLFGALQIGRSIVTQRQAEWRLVAEEFTRSTFSTIDKERMIRKFQIDYSDFVAFGDILKMDLFVSFCFVNPFIRTTKCNQISLTALLFFEFEKPVNESLTRVEFLNMDIFLIHWLGDQKLLKTTHTTTEKTKPVSCSISFIDNMTRIGECKYSDFFNFHSEWNDYYNVTTLLNE